MGDNEKHRYDWHKGHTRKKMKGGHGIINKSFCKGPGIPDKVEEQFQRKQR